jgi:hypothetical protein
MIRVNDLERLLAAAAQDPVRRPEFIARLFQSDVYVLGYLDRPTVGNKAVEGTTMSLVTWGDAAGPITPFFTSEQMVQATVAARPGTDSRFVRMGARDLFQMVSGQRLVLNPDGPNSKIFMQDEVKALAAGREPGVVTEVLQAQRQVLVGAAAHVPPELINVLSRFLAKRTAVYAAHLGWIAHPDGQQGYLMVVVADDREAAMAGFGSVQIGEITGGPTLDVVVVPPKEVDHMLSSVPAFYKRESKRWGLFGRH